MPRISRVVLEGYPHHITQRGVRSMDIFFSDEDRHYYIEQLRKNCEDHKVKINGYCLMTNHVHLILTPSKESSLGLCLRETHKAYTRRINFAQGVKGHLFQGRFFSCPLDEPYYITAMRYVERNPVKAKMVRLAWSYKWSSAAFHMGKVKNDPLIANRDDLLGTEDSWKETLQSNPKDTDYFLERTRTGRPCGSDAFIEIAEKLTGRDLFSKPAGRPKQ